jgi:hypothetical protein
MSAAYFDGPRLLADIGAARASFALETAPGCIGDVATLPCAHYRLFEDAAADYLASVAQRERGRIHHAVIAIATGGAGQAGAPARARHRWEHSIVAARVKLELDTLLVVSDFFAPPDPAGAGGGASAPGLTWLVAAPISALHGAAAMLAAALAPRHTGGSGHVH